MEEDDGVLLCFVFIWANSKAVAKKIEVCFQIDVSQQVTYQVLKRSSEMPYKMLMVYIHSFVQLLIAAVCTQSLIKTTCATKVSLNRQKYKIYFPYHNITYDKLCPIPGHSMIL